jgi:enoyl-CoA hydratase/carnithine racemase/3-hydroxyacyl-CoA dehydrogenase
MKAMRQPTLETLGLGSVIDIFQKGKLPADEATLVDKVFGPANGRGSLVISGGNGIVGSGKAMQLGSRLLPHGVPIVTIDLPDAPDGIGQQWPGLKGSFGAKTAGEIMANIVKFNYDGSSLPKALGDFNPRFLLEAIPEILPLKRSHYDLMRGTFPEIEIRSVTSGFPNKELGVGILHPSFPHQINKIWEVVEETPSDITKLLLAMGLIPVPVGDYWSFILDVLFCGITQAAIRYHGASNMPFWKVDKYVRRLVGPNPLRAHDAIGPGASFLTWSCLHHLAETYGEVFRPSPELVRRKESGEAWYSSNRPTVDWDMDDEAAFEAWVLGPIFQMTSLMLHEKRAHLTHMNAIGELCAQFTSGVNALIRSYGADKVISTVEAYHKVHPEAAGGCWYPDVFEQTDTPEWQQLYVNAEHDGKVGVITISRESLNWDVVHELNRAVDWLKAEGIKHVIVTGDFHLSTQMVGADTTEFFPALDSEEAGTLVAKTWSEAARRLHNEFDVSVGFVAGKRCLGGMMELLMHCHYVVSNDGAQLGMPEVTLPVVPGMHCHYVVSNDGAQLGMPEVTLPVVPGMEGCHWSFRKAKAADFPKLFELLLTGRSVKAKDAQGWLVDYAGPMEDAIAKAWSIASGGDHGVPLRKIEENKVSLPADLPKLPAAPNKAVEAGREEILGCIRASCAVPLSQALEVQAQASARFMTTTPCKKGAIGSAAKKTLEV